MKLKENYSGSIAILLVGCLYFALELYGVESEHTLGGVLSGTGIILAAIAYRSAKRRRIYISEPTTFRIGLESVLILTSFFLLFMFSVGDVMFFTYQPLTSIVWLGSIAAYIFMVFGSRTNDVITYKSNANDGEKKISIETPNLIADSKPQLDINKSKNFFIKFKETISGESNISVSATEFFGSSAAIVLGVLYFLSGVNVAAQKTGGSANGLVFGLVIILGALAYKSAKKRKLNIVATTVIREIFEIVAILLILASVLMLNVDIKKFMAETPVSFLIWLWALIPYFIMVFSIRNKKYENTKATSKEADKSVESPVLNTNSNIDLDSNKNFFIKLKDGDYGLAKTYWLYGVVVNVIFKVLGAYAGSYSEKLFATVLIVNVAYLLLWLIGFYNSIRQYYGSKVWVVLSYLMILIWVLNTLMLITVLNTL
ncbi:MAG TPA: hypothetical protein EYQ06_05890 [Flavobacteriales bacterium]|nr:hypothetical protein [Flavobacteriales bacterium]